MKIINELNVEKVQFESIRKGEVFATNEESIYIKLRKDPEYNCLNLETGWKHNVSNTAYVIPIDATLIIRPRKNEVE